jgi:protein TonB
MEDEDDNRGLGRFAAPAIIIIVLVMMGVGLWWLISGQTTGTRRAAAPIQTVTLTPPPPPPPPPKPPEPKVQEPDKTIDEPKPQDAPQEAPKQLTIAGPAQAGTDSFGIAAGSGGGGVVLGSPGGLGATPGGSFGEAAYRRYMSGALQQALQSDSRINRLVFSGEVLIWLDRSGRVSKVTISRGSGNAKTDQQIVAVLGDVRLDEAPAPNIVFPQRVSVRGRRS